MVPATPSRASLHKPPRVALVIETTRAYGRRILQGVADYVSENGPWLLYVEPRAVFDCPPRWLRRWDGDGILARVGNVKDLEQLAKGGIPVVNLRSSTLSELAPPPVVTDHEAIGRMAAEHLMERGFRHFAFVGIPGSRWSDLRYQGFCRYVGLSGFSCDQYIHSKKVLATYRDGALVEDIDRIAAWIDRLAKPLGVMAADDFLGIQVLNGCRCAEIPVPDQVGVIGVDNEATICQLARPPLTSVVPDNVRLGYEAAALLDGLMQGRPLPEHPVRIPPLKVVTRQSSDVVAVDDPIVARAMLFVREHACRGCNVNDLLRHLLISRTVLQHRFQKALGQSPYDAIVKVRIARIKQLLAESTLSLKEIAIRSGFKHPEHMGTVFKELTGDTPARYRRKYARSKDA